MPDQYKEGDIYENDKGQRVQLSGGRWIPVLQQEGVGTKIARGAALGAFSGLGIPETQTPVSDFFKNLLRQTEETPGRLVEEVNKYGIAAPGAELANIVKGAARSAGGAVKETYRGVRGRDVEEASHGLGSLLTQLAMLGLGVKAGGTSVSESEALALPKTAIKEIAGGGPSMDRLIAAKDLNALELKSRTLAPLEKAVHDDAQATIRSAVERMEQHSPAVANKADLAEQVDKEWKEFVKIPETVPEPIKQLLGGKSSTATPRALSAAELRAAQVAAQLFKEGATAKDVQSSMLNLGFTPKAVDAIMAVGHPEADTGFWSPRELQQVRSKLGNVAFGRAGRSVPGPVRVAAVNTYRMVSQILEDTARKANALQAWQVGNQKWKLYNETFDGKWEGGEFHDSPLADALRGQTSDEIMNALGKSKLQWTRDLTGRYQRFAPRALQDINRSLSRHDRLEMIRAFSHPSKWEATTALAFPLAPHVWEAMAGIRLLSPPILRRLATMGINPENVRGFREVTPGLPEEPAPARPSAPAAPTAPTAPKVEGISIQTIGGGQTQYSAVVNGKSVKFTAPSGLTRAEIEREAIFYSGKTP